LITLSTKELANPETKKLIIAKEEYAAEANRTDGNVEAQLKKAAESAMY